MHDKISPIQRSNLIVMLLLHALIVEVHLLSINCVFSFDRGALRVSLHHLLCVSLLLAWNERVDAN